MRFPRGRFMRGLARHSKRALNAVAGWFAVGVLKTIRLLNPDRMGDFAGWVLRHIGPLLREHRIGRDNLVAAFPEKSAAEFCIECEERLEKCPQNIPILERMLEVAEELSKTND